jgi:hypothetical protein
VIDGIMVLQRGENPSTDYYLRQRLGACGLPGEIVDVADEPAASGLLGRGGAQALMVVICRYAAPAWLEALERAAPRLARVAFFMDDDLPEMMRAREIPSSARGKVALHFGAHVERLSALASEVWVSTPELAGRYAEARPSVLGPLPEAEPPEPSAGGAELVAYHGTDVHPRERRFVLEVAREVCARSPGALFEVIGDKALARAASGLGAVEIAPQLSWPDYLRTQSGRSAAISLAPLFPSRLNDARAPVKAIDAARLGAAGLYADAPAYRGHVRHGEDGLLLPMEPGAWAEAIVALLADPDRRLRLARAARARLAQALRGDGGFPAAPAG